MCMRSLSFVLLVWLVGDLHAQPSEQFCRPPSLDHGYVFPYNSAFRHGSDLSYACDNGYKPAVEGWWAKITCEDGKWSHEAKCIDENACLPPTIPNAGYVENSEGWYAQRIKLMITCNKGYKHKGPVTSVMCVDGSWTLLPVCEESEDTCGEPPKVPHAVIINEEHQVVFEANSQLQYQCKDGYRTDTGHTQKTISCEAGNWTKVPTCTRSRTDSGTNEPETGHSFTTIDTCGRVPIIENGVIVETELTYFKYKCAAYYTRVGSDTVRCYSDGSWSQEAACKASYCTVNTERSNYLKNVGQIYIEDNKTKRLECQTSPYEWAKYTDILCIGGTIKATKCCTEYNLRWNYC